MSEFRTMDDWVRLARMPWSMISSGLDFMWRVSLPPGYYERYGGAIADLDARWRDGPESQRGTRSESRSATRSNNWGESDDLSGDDLKLVRYKLFFTKRGHEKVLETGEEFVSYDTDATSYSGRLVARYFNEHSIPEDEHRYLRVNLRVLARFPKEDADHDARMVDLMQQQVDILGQIERRVQPSGGGRVAA